MSKYTAIVDPNFHNLIAHFSDEQLNNKNDIIYGLWPNLTIGYINSNSIKFSEENGGMGLSSTSWQLGKNVMDAIPPLLKEFYHNLFEKALDPNSKNSAPVQHEYECSSADLFRLVQMTLYPLGNREGILVLNSIVHERQHDPFKRVATASNEERFRHQNGFIYQCIYCRKIRDKLDENRWDWVPEWVEKIPPNTSHSLCRFCHDYYFRRVGINLKQIQKYEL